MRGWRYCVNALNVGTNQLQKRSVFGKSTPDCVWKSLRQRGAGPSGFPGCNICPHSVNYAQQLSTGFNRSIRNFGTEGSSWQRQQLARVGSLAFASRAANSCGGVSKLGDAFRGYAAKSGNARSTAPILRRILNLGSADAPLKAPFVSLGSVARLLSLHRSAPRTGQTTRAFSSAATFGIASRTCSRQLRQSLRGLKGCRHRSTTAGAAVNELGAHVPQSMGVARLAEGLPRGAQRAIAWWLGTCAAWVASMVVLGGLTRLTRSGLSMTDWKFTGERPPLSAADWEAEFAKYHGSPEYRRMNRGMSLEEFKFIYWMEYAHRMWGRVLGLVFAGPALYFAARGWINSALARRLGILFLMGGTQGLVGWWMVRSGLQEPEEEWREVRVSPYRLAAHLTSAFVIYATLLWTSLQLAVPVPPAANPGIAAGLVPSIRQLRMWAHPLAGLIALTAFSGTFVAGLDAGRAYNTFPTMNGQWLPREYWAVPGWRNAFENTAAVQFNHRVLALTTLTAVCTAWAAHRTIPLPRPCRLLLNGLLLVTAAQVTLGVTTLLTYVPVSLGSAHQAGALTLFSLALGLIYSVKSSPRLAPLRAPVLARWLTPAAAASLLLVGAGAAQLQ